MSALQDKVVIQNIRSPHHVQKVDRQKYEAMRSALLAVVPVNSPGISVADAKQRLLTLLPQDLFPGGDKAGWWLKAVQLDLEAKEMIVREQTKPLRLYRAGTTTDA